MRKRQSAPLWSTDSLDGVMLVRPVAGGATSTLLNCQLRMSEAEPDCNSDFLRLGIGCLVPPSVLSDCDVHSGSLIDKMMGRANTQ